MKEKNSEFIISSESKLLYEQFKFINLNDNSKRLDSSICKMIRNDYEYDKNLYLDVKKFLNENRKKIIAIMENKEKDKYCDIVENFNIIGSCIDIVHLNQIVNELLESKV